jgi:hypothetical protein
VTKVHAGFDEFLGGNRGHAELNSNSCERAHRRKGQTANP